MTTVNWEDLFNSEEAKPPPMIKKGTYNVTVNNADWKMSASNNKMLVVNYQIAGGPFDKQMLTQFITIDPSSKWLHLSLSNLNALGLTKDKLISLSEPEQEEFLVGRQVSAKVDVGEYNGQPQANVKGISPTNKSVEDTPPSSSGSSVPPAAPFGG